MLRSRAAHALNPILLWANAILEEEQTAPSEIGYSDGSPQRGTGSQFIDGLA